MFIHHRNLIIFEFSPAGPAWPCQIQPTTVRPLKVGKNNTSIGMMLQHVTYYGADSFTITTKPLFSRLSRMLVFHEALSIFMRKDINTFLSQFVKEGVLTKDFAKNLQIHATNQYPKGSVSKYTEYSKYVPLSLWAILFPRQVHMSPWSGLHHKKIKGANKITKKWRKNHKTPS